MIGKALLAFVTLVGYLPKIEAFITLIEDTLAAYRKQQALKAFDKAALAAKTTKDTCELEKMFDPSKQCPPSTPSGVQDGSASKT